MNPSAANKNALQIVRPLDASRDRAYAVWTDLESAREWWGPDGCETLEMTIDARVGGKYRWRLQTPMGEMMAFGEYREIQPGKKLVYTWQWADDPAWENHPSVVTVEFLEKTPATSELRLTHEEFPNEQSRENHIGGWNSALDRYVRLLTASASTSA